MENMSEMQDPIEKRMSGIIKNQFPDIDFKKNISEQIDSIYFIKLILAIEKEFKINFYPNEYDQNHFQSVKTISNLIRRRNEQSS